MDALTRLEQSILALRETEARAARARDELRAAELAVSAARAALAPMLDPSILGELTGPQATESRAETERDYRRMFRLLEAMSPPRKDYRYLAQELYGSTEIGAIKRANMQMHYLKVKGLVSERGDGTLELHPPPRG